MFSVSQTIFKNLISAALLSLCLMLSAEVWAVSPESLKSKEIGIITAVGLNLRPAPSTEESPLKKLKTGSKVIILGHHNDWLKVSHNGQVGYISNNRNYVHIIGENSGQKSVAADIEMLKKNIATIDRKIETQTAKVKQYTAQEMKIIDELNQIDQRLNQTNHQVAKLKSEMAEIEKELSQTRTSIENLTHEIRESDAYITRRLTALYKLNLLGRIHVFASAESVYEMLNRKSAIEHILAADSRVLETQLANQTRLTELEHRLNVQKETKQSLETEYNKRAELMLFEKTRRSALLEDIRTKKALQAASIQQLKDASINLDQILNALLLESKCPSSNKSLKESKHFSSYKGLLKMPVKGRIISYFGTDKDSRNQTVTFNSGIEIEAERGEPIQAVCSGTVLFSNWFKGYGNLIIIHHNDNYYTLYAHAEELFKAQGDTVETGEVIATVGDTGSMTGPKLHFEVRHHGKPLNPLEWLDHG